MKIGRALRGNDEQRFCLFALHLGVLDRAQAAAARKTVADAVRSGTITLEGGVRQVPTDPDFSPTTAWEHSMCALNTCQNGGYPTGHPRLPFEQAHGQPPGLWGRMRVALGAL